jgi:hypothetical protein
MGLARLIAACVISCCLSPALLAVDYAKDIKPLLKNRCYACHGALKQKADLRMDTANAMRKGGDNGDILAREHSLLLERVTTKDIDERMPPEGEGSALTTEEVAKLKAWIDAGAPAPADETPEADPRAHWAYQVPKSSGKSIDALLAARFVSKQLKPQPPAAPEVWLRRVYVDLLGVPPTPEEIAEFTSDTSAHARQLVVDRLLASPQYGERWARHFMDIWRYCDWYGLGAQLRHSQKHIWHWRDWIVESLNADKGYKRMIIEMLAADELAPEDRDNLRATGFLARSYYLFNRTTWLDETIEHTCRAFLGVTMQCVKCHDHKYDPIDQADYYRMRAVFEPLHVRLDPWQGETDFEKNGLPRVFDLHLDTPTYRHVRGDEKNEDKSRALTAGVPAVLEFASFQPETVKLPETASRPALLPFVLQDQLRVAEQQIAEARKSLEKAKHAFANAPAPSRETDSKEVIRDDFRAERPEAWQPVTGEWRYTDGLLRAHEKGVTRSVMHLKAGAPADFEASLIFNIRGGKKWKSVGIVFDSEGDNSAMVYMSAVEGASRLQITLADQGKFSYPPGTSIPHKIMEGVRYTLELKVRGQLVNASIDGVPVLAHRLSRARQPGAIGIGVFDAEADFHDFRLATLSANAPMREAQGGPVASASVLQTMVTIAEKQLAAAEAKPAMLRAVFAATQGINDKALAQSAAMADAAYRLAEAEAKLALAQKDPAAKDVEKNIKAARDALEKAKKKSASPGETYTPLTASLKAQEGPAENNNTAVQSYPETSTGRRLALAKWIADERNPLTARVLVNHVWTRHFGASLVPDVGDFGLRCTAPLHQDVLDSLTVDFMNNGWSMKQLHRAMVLSDLYARSSSGADADARTILADPDNTCYWRMNPRRLESQAVRDSLLHIAGRLDPSIGGPSIDPAKVETSLRRSIYFIQTADVEHRFLATFDNSNVLECYRRNESVVPQQALALTNSQLSRDCADALAGKMKDLPEEAFITKSFLVVLSRQPSPEELRVSLEGFRELEGNRSLFLQALINHNDFVTLR